jgi:hypothetical protein
MLISRIVGNLVHTYCIPHCGELGANILHLGTILTQESFVHGNHLYMGTICTWEPFVPGSHMYMGTICT